MGKAEEKSQNRYSTLAEKYAFIDGYEQAEKDLALTWKDMELIYHLSDEIPYMEHNDFFKELLKRYNEKKKELV